MMKDPETRRGGRRAGAGRKPLESAERLRPRSINMTDDEWGSCQVQWCSGISGSEYVRRLIQKDIKQRRLSEQEQAKGEAQQGASPSEMP